MGYDLHITRKEDWSDEQGPAIGAVEWLRIVEQDPELHLETINGPYFAIWSGPSKYPDPWLDWSDGNVYTKNPDQPLIRKMLQIAARLGAKVQGDDGEVYDEATLLAQAPSTHMTGRTWLAFLGSLGLYCLVAFFLGFLLLAILLLVTG
jgi:hypothetical protein